MTLNVFEKNDQAAGFMLSIITIPICLGMTIFRFLGSVQANRKPMWDDWFALFALVFHLTFCVMFIYVLTILNGMTYEELAVSGPNGPDKLTTVLKVGWAMSTNYNPNQFFAKMSLLILYWRLFSINTTLRISVWILGVIQTGWFVGCWVARWLTCVPVSQAWDLNSDKSGCRERGPYVAAAESINTAIDFVMVGLAIWMIFQLKVRNSVRWKLSLLFIIGSLSGLIGVVKIAEIYSTAYVNVFSSVWDVAQMATSIICCCVPVYRPAFRGINFEKIRSTIAASLLGTLRRSPPGSQRSQRSQRSNPSASPPESLPESGPRRAQWIKLEDVRQNNSNATEP